MDCELTRGVDQADEVPARPFGAWSRPKNLPSEDFPTPILGPELLPAVLRPWVLDTAERMQMPPDLIVVPALVAAGTLLAGKLGVAPKCHDDWIEIPNLYGATIGKPGLGKSPCEQEALKPYRQAQEKAQREWEVECAGLGEGENRPPSPRFMVGDATVEKLGEIIAGQPGRAVLVYRSEISGLFRSFHKRGRETDRAFYLEAWDGKNAFHVDRILRGSIKIPRLVLGVFGGIQPGVIAPYIEEAKSSGSGADGLLQRFGLLVWPDVSPSWRNVDREPDYEARASVFEAFQRLDDLSPEQIGARPLTGHAVPCLRFAEAAQLEMDCWREELMVRLRHERGDSEAFTAHLSKYQKLVPCLALIFHLLDGGVGPIALGPTHLAIRWASEYLEAHARKVYGEPALPGLAEAHALADRILDGEIEDACRVRTIYRKGWTQLRGRTAVIRGLRLLERLGWLRIESVGDPPFRGQRIVLNPLVRREARTPSRSRGPN